MRFAIDAHAIGRQLTGNEVYVRNLLRALAAQARDCELVAYLSSDVVLAGQLGGGFELEVAPRTVIALQADCTMLYREGRGDGQTLASGQLWATLLAARARF